MPIIKVLINNKGEVVGTQWTHVGGSGTAPPERVTLVARPDQELIEVTVDDKVALLDPAALHATLKANYLKSNRPMKEKRGKKKK